MGASKPRRGGFVEAACGRAGTDKFRAGGGPC